MAALEDGEMKSTLTNPIHPMFQRKQWETRSQIPKHRGAIPIRGDYDGYWLAEEPVVWNILEPSLRLASLFLTNASYYSWWDALFNGTYKDIPTYRIPDSHLHETFLSFHQRPYHIRNTPEAISDMQIRLLTASERIRFRLFSGYTNCNTNIPVKEIFHYGETNVELWEGNVRELVRVNVAIEVLQPLLRGDLTDAERISGQFRLAATLVHEVAHAVWETIKPDMRPLPAIEPFFEDEVMCELGWSLEDKFWAGEALDIIQPAYSRGRPGLPHIGTVKTNWFTDRHSNHASGRLPLLEYAISLPDEAQDPFYTFDYWPIPVSWAYSMFQPGLWDTKIRNIGNQAMEMGPLTLGTRRLSDEPVDDGFQVLGSVDDLNNFMAAELGMNAQQLDDVKAENARRVRAAKIYATMNRDQLSSEFPDSDSDSADDQDETEESVECPRWDEITQYLFQNRGPLELAINTMTFEMSEPTFYRYIRERGSLDITPAEFRDFLKVAHRRRLLFSYLPFPGPGTMILLPTGWPPSSVYTLPVLASPSPRNIQNFTSLLMETGVQARFYAEFGEFRDLDYTTLHGIISAFLPPKERMSREEIVLCVNECARRGSLVTLGPERIARMTGEIGEEVRNEWGGGWVQEKMKWNAAERKKAVDEQRRLDEAKEEFDDSGLRLEDLEELERDGLDEDLDEGIDMRGLGLGGSP